MKKIHYSTILALTCIFAGLALGVVPWFVTESYEAYQASALYQTTRVVGVGLILAPTVAVVGYAVLDFCFLLSAIFRRMNRWTWRKWGALPGIAGVLLCVGSPGPDDMPNSMPMMFGAITFGISLIAFGWLINHWPPRSYWPYIIGRDVVPPRRHLPYSPNMEGHGN